MTGPIAGAAPAVLLPRSAAGRHNPWLIAIIVSIASFMEVLDTTIANVSLRHIAGGLAVTPDESTWVLTSYLVSNAVILPISGWLASVLGRKQFYMGCVALFTLSSACCGLSTSLSQLIVFRIVQGLGGGGLAPTEQSMFADTFPPEKRGQAFALYGFTVILAPAIGPVLGGWITDNISWRWIFLINLPVGILSLILVWIFVDEPPALKRDRAAMFRNGFVVDWLGFVLVFVGFGALQIVLDRWERDEGFASPLITLSTIVAVLSLAVLGPWEWLHPNPAVDLRLFRHRSFLLASLIMSIVGFMMISTTQLMPQFSQELLHYNALTAGLALGLGGLATLSMIPLAGALVGRVVQPRWLIMMAFCGLSASLFNFASLDLEISFWTVSLARCFQAMWMPFMFVSVSTVSYIGVPPEKSNQASAISNLTRNLGGSLGISLATTMLAERTQYHHARLAEHVSAYSLKVHDLGFRFADGTAGATRFLATEVAEQASLLSYLDIFRLAGFLALLCVPLSLLLPKTRKGTSAAMH